MTKVNSTAPPLTPKPGKPKKPYKDSPLTASPKQARRAAHLPWISFSRLVPKWIMFINTADSRLRHSIGNGSTELLLRLPDMPRDLLAVDGHRSRRREAQTHAVSVQPDADQDDFFAELNRELLISLACDTSIRSSNVEIVEAGVGSSNTHKAGSREHGVGGGGLLHTVNKKR